MKNWKKQKTRRGLSKWVNNAGQFMYVTNATNTMGKGMYTVDSNHPQFWLTASYFDTRAKAMAHALDFMQRHDEPSAGNIIFGQHVDLKTMFKG